MSQFKQVVNKTLKPYNKPLAEVDHQNSVDLMLQCKLFYLIYSLPDLTHFILQYWNSILQTAIVQKKK